MINNEKMCNLREAVQNYRPDTEIMQLARELVAADDGYIYSNFSVGGYAFGGTTYVIFYVNVKYKEGLEESYINGKIIDYIVEKTSSLDLQAICVNDEEKDSYIKDKDVVLVLEGEKNI